MQKATLRIHVQNDETEPLPLVLTPEILSKALAARPELSGKIVASFGTTAAGFPDDMRDCEALFTNTKLSLDAAAKIAPGLRWTQSMSAGIEGFLPTLPPSITLVNASGVHAEKGGEFVLTAALMLNARIPQFVIDQQNRAWNPVFSRTLASKSILLLGTGSIGLAAAHMLKPFGCRLTGFNRSGSGIESLDKIIGQTELDAALTETDILVSTLPLTSHTGNLIDRRRIDLLPEGAGVIVVGRAKVLDYEALFDRLDAGTLAGAVLDVFPAEPIGTADRAWTTPRLIMTPHCSVDDHSRYMAMCLDIFLDNLENDLAGRPLRNVVDPAAGY